MPELRRRPLAELKLFRVRVDQRSRPPIWRRLDVRSYCDHHALHQVLQAAYSWDNYHLWRFCLGGEPFDRDSQPSSVRGMWRRASSRTRAVSACEVRLDESCSRSPAT